MVGRLLLLAALSMVVTLAFASVAQAQYQDVAATPYVNSNDPGDCVKNDNNLDFGPLIFLPDSSACIVNATDETAVYPPLIFALKAPVYDPVTGGNIGMAKNLDPDLSSGANSVTSQELCGTFPISSGYVSEGQTAQQYYVQEANAKERAILDPNGDGLACTAEDAAFLNGTAQQPTAPSDLGSDFGLVSAQQPNGQQTGDPQCINGRLDINGDGRISAFDSFTTGFGGAPCAGGIQQPNGFFYDSGKITQQTLEAPDNAYNRITSPDSAYSRFVYDASTPLFKGLDRNDSTEERGTTSCSALDPNTREYYECPQEQGIKDKKSCLDALNAATRAAGDVATNPTSRRPYSSLRNLDNFGEEYRAAADC